MKRLLKTLGKLAFFTLMLAVALRPVVVDAIAGYALPETGSFSPAIVQSSGLLPITTCPNRLTAHSPAFSNLKVIPKETVNVDGLTPRFAESSISLDSNCRSVVGSIFRSHSPRKFLVLRI